MMLRVVLIGLPLLLILAGGAGYFGQRWKAFSGPALAGELEVDLGTCRSRSQIRFGYPIRNDGRTPLEISHVRSTCGCLFVGGAGSPIIVEPGETARLDLLFNLQGKRGSQSTITVTLATNDPRYPGVDIRFRYRIAGGLLSFPREGVLGELSPGEKATLDLVLRWTDGGDAKVPTRVVWESGVDGQAKLLPAKQAPAKDPSATSGGQAVGVCQLEVTAPLTAGEFVGKLLLFIGDEDMLPACVVPVTGRVEPFAKLQPESVVLPRQGGAGPIYSTTVMCRVRAEGKPVLEVSDLPKDLAVAIGESQGNGLTPLVVTWDPARSSAGQPERRTVKVKVTTGTQSMTLPMTVICRKAG